MGTDWQGYDVLSRLLYGARTSLFIGTMVVLLAGTFGVLVGLYAGYKGGRADRWLMGWVDVQVSFPGLLLAMLLIALVGGSVMSVTVILAINGWMVYARMTRGVVLSAKERPFVEAAELVGCKPKRVVFKHILPNLISPLTTLAVLEFARIILAEAALSYLGLGIQYPGVSWGLDVARAMDHELFGNQWLIIYPGILLSLTVLVGQPVEQLAARRARPPRAREAVRGDGHRLGRQDRRRPVSDTTVAPVDDAPTGLLEVDHLYVKFFTRRGVVHAVRDVSFTVGRGETVGLVGESGSGKSVTAQALMGLIDLPGRITGGDVRWKGESLVQRRRRDPATRPRQGDRDDLPGPDDIARSAVHRRQPDRRGAAPPHGDAQARRARAGHRAPRPGGNRQPAERVDQHPHEMSGGMRQRVLIAMALACEPELLIADEPTTALDVTIQAQILELIGDLQQRLGLSVLLITHDLGVVAGLCDRVAVMYSGKIVELAPAADLYRDPGHPYTAGLLRSTPRLDIVIPRLVSIDGSPPDLVNPPNGCAFAARCALGRRAVPRRHAGAAHPLTVATRRLLATVRGAVREPVGRRRRRRFAV